MELNLEFFIKKEINYDLLHKRAISNVKKDLKYFKRVLKDEEYKNYSWLTYKDIIDTCFNLNQIYKELNSEYCTLELITECQNYGCDNFKYINNNLYKRYKSDLIFIFESSKSPSKQELNLTELLDYFKENNVVISATDISLWKKLQSRYKDGFFSVFY